MPRASCPFFVRMNYEAHGRYKKNPIDTVGVAVLKYIPAGGQV